MTKIFLLFAVLAFFISCNTRSNKSGDTSKPIVTVSILPQKTFIEKIAGNDFDIQVLVPHGASPETYELIPSQLKQIAQSSVWFRLGYIGFEVTWMERMGQISRGMELVNLSEGLDLIAGNVIQHGDHVHLEGVDPHTWMSPRLVKQMSERTTRVLSELNPERKSVYENNFHAFSKEIDELDATLRAALKDYRGRSFFTFHPGLAYYARDYNLIQYALEADGKEPTAQHMAKMVELAKKENIGVIYIQSEFDQDHAKVFAEEIKGEVVELSPLDPEWKENLLEM